MHKNDENLKCWISFIGGISDTSIVFSLCANMKMLTSLSGVNLW